MKSLAQLKKDAKSGKLFAEMIIRQGSREVPEKLQGIRQIVDSNSVGITFLTKDNKRSELRIECASLTEYTDDYITLYRPGLRPLTKEEQAVFDKWEMKRDKEQEEIDLITDCNVSYYRRKNFFIDEGYEYLLGMQTLQGKKYDFNTKNVYDNAIKGKLDMQYKIIKS